MVAFKVEMPQVGESVTEGIIGKWLVAPGDTVRKYDPLAEVVTDKVNMEVSATTDGTVTKLIAEEGATVAMGSVIAEMDVAEGAKPDSQTLTDSGDAAEDSSDYARTRQIGTMVMGANVGPTGGEFQDTSLETGNMVLAGSATRERTGTPGSERRATSERGQVFSPVVMRLAATHDIDLTQLVGTGRGGRVTKRDVERYLEDNADGDSRGQVATAEQTADQVVQPSPIRRMIAERMARSAREIPHAWAAVEVDASQVVRFNETEQRFMRRAYGSHLTYLPISAFMVARSLRRHPQLNASWSSDGVILKGSVNLGIAVATERGLVVPVVKEADCLDLRQTVDECSRLVEAARDGKLSIDDVSDGTFTLNNTGAFGSMLGGAIINYPQAAILNTEAITRRPVVIEHADGSESIGIRPMMNLCLSFDHRVIDGAEAMAFLNDVKSQFESADFGETVN